MELFARLPELYSAKREYQIVCGSLRPSLNTVACIHNKASLDELIRVCSEVEEAYFSSMRSAAPPKPKHYKYLEPELSRPFSEPEHSTNCVD